MPEVIEIGGIVMALLLGVAFVYSLSAQLKLQKRAVEGDRKASLFARVTMAGLSMAIVFALIVVANETAHVISTPMFILISFVGAVTTWAVRWRSNRTVKRDARKSGVRPLP